MPEPAHHSICKSLLQGALLVALALLGGCGKPRYWVEGLDLPPGAVEASRIVSRTTDNQTPGQPATARAGRFLHVAFDSNLEWPALIQHFEGCLDKAGYKETPDTFLLGPTGRQPDYRYYTASDRKKAVMLHDHQLSRNQMAQVGLGRRDGPGRYELTVIAK